MSEKGYILPLDNDAIFEYMTHLYVKNKILKEENEQLRKDNEQLKKKNEELQFMCKESVNKNTKYKIIRCKNEYP